MRDLVRLQLYAVLRTNQEEVYIYIYIYIYGFGNFIPFPSVNGMKIGLGFKVVSQQIRIEIACVVSVHSMPKCICNIRGTSYVYIFPPP